MNVTELSRFERRDWDGDADGTVRFAMIALGWWTREKAIPAVQTSDYGDTTVVVSGSQAKADEVAGEWDSIEHALTYEAFLAGEATDAYDAVYICTPNALHLPYVEAAAEFEKAILCEKPMEASVERAEELVGAAAAVPLMIAYRMHTEPAVRRARDLVVDGVLGEPVLVHGNMSQPLLELIPDPDQWRLQPELVGYGTSVLDIGLYPLNTTRFVLDRDPLRVQAMTHADHEAFANVPDERAAFQVAYPDGVFGSFTASQHAAQESHLTVVGTDGTLTIAPAFFPWTPRGMRLTVDGTTASLDWEQVDQMREEFDYFAHCLLTDEALYADGEHGLVDMRTIESIYEAARTGETVTVGQ